MKITNKHNLPQALVDAIKNDPYTRGVSDISVTQLISPVKKVSLERKHVHELEEDASGRIWSLIGQAVHTILERANSKDLVERRFYLDVLGKRISGQIDALLTDGNLIDYKVTSAWQVKSGVKDEWEKQLNICRYLIEHSGSYLSIARLSVVAILRDWSKLEAQRSEDYPQSQVVMLPVKMWTSEETRKYIEERVTLHFSDTLPDCNSVERWQRPSVWAVMKQDQKKAVKLFYSPEDADQFLLTNPKLFVVKREGMSIRCKFYCSALSFCSQGQSLTKGDSNEIS